MALTEKDFRDYGKKMGYADDEIEFTSRVGVVISDVLDAAVLTTCAAIKMTSKKSHARALVLLKVEDWLMSHQREFLTDPDEFLRALTLWVRDTIQDYFLTKKET